MENCQFYNATRLIIRQNGSVDIVAHLTKDNITKVLLLTGKTAVKKIGLHDQIVQALDAAKI